MNWTGCTCEICNKPLQETDDVVVCPECGTPYHRACYAEVGHCLHEKEHGTDYVYRRAGETVATQRCGNCGTPNSESNLFCENCGAPLGERQMPAQNAAEQNKTRAAVPEEFVGTPFESMVGTAMHQDYDGISSADWATYIGKSAPYYMMQFERMDKTGHKTSICWSALFFGPFYFLYRKMWSIGILTALLSFLISVPSFLMLLQEMNVSIGISLSAQTLTTLLTLCMPLNWALQIACGIFAFYLFRRHAASRLTAMRDACETPEAFHEVVAQNAGPSIVGVVALIVVIFVASYALTAWIGPEKFMNWMNLNL